MAVAADLSGGQHGIASFEFAPDDTDINTGSYYLQVVWALFGSTRKFIVLDETVQVKSTVKI